MTVQEGIAEANQCEHRTYVQHLRLGVEVLRTVERVLTLLSSNAGFHDLVACLEVSPASAALDLDAEVAISLQAPLRQH